MATNRTFTMIKPDAVQDGHIGAILAQINAVGFRIVAMKLTQLSPAKAESSHKVHKERPFYGNWFLHVFRSHCCSNFGKKIMLLRI